jgi:galactokinase
MAKTKMKDRELVEAHSAVFGRTADAYVYAPGRAELGGNHTDHQGGKVLAGAIDLFVQSAVSRVPDPVVTIRSKGQSDLVIDLNCLEPVPGECGSSEALVRGVASALYSRGYRIGGLSFYTESDIPIGIGLSSSAAFENMIAFAFNLVYNGGVITPYELAMSGHVAETIFFCKPSGLLDQMTSAVGGVVCLDFFDEDAPGIVQIPFDLASFGYALVIVDTGGSHADLTAEYASIPQEMRSVAAAFGKARLADVDRADFMAALMAGRSFCSDRAALRALHYFEENERVDKMCDALICGDLSSYFSLVRKSGLSSELLLQNAVPPGEVKNQPIPLALAVTRAILSGSGATRLQGGGFAGSIQAYVKTDCVPDYIAAIDRLFGKGAARVVGFSAAGAGGRATA